MREIFGDTLELFSKANIPISMISAELEGIYGNAVLHELNEIIRYYNIYDSGADFSLTATDYVPADLHYKLTKALIDKEARFLFGKTPEITIEPTDVEELTDSDRNNLTIMQSFMDYILKVNKFPSKILKAAKDCFIGKRVALFVNFNSDGIQITFSPSLEFVFETEDNDSEILKKIICFYTVKEDAVNRNNQRIYKKKYWMENGFCWISEELYDGAGHLIEEINAPFQTKLQFIPAIVIINDGLTGDINGESEIKQLAQYESWYSKLSNGDMDAERFGMSPIRYTIDMSPESTKNISAAAGSFWDLTSDGDIEGTTGQVGVLEQQMGYSASLTTTLDRIKNTMFEQIDLPNISPLTMQGVITSGKGLKAIYWPLIVRCNEKMTVWGPALERMTEMIIEGAKLYPESSAVYGYALPDMDYNIKVDNQYPLPEDETEEKTNDLAEVNALTMSKKSYMKKWRGLTDTEADEELKQLALEKQLLEDSYMPMGMSDQTENTDENNDDNEDE